MTLKISNKLFYSISFVFVFFTWYWLINPVGNKLEFDSEKWKTVDFNSADNLFTRWEMVDDLQNNHLLKGMSKLGVIKILGKPEIQTGNDFHYILGHSKKDKGTGSLILVFNTTGTITNFYVWDNSN